MCLIVLHRVGSGGAVDGVRPCATAASAPGRRFRASIILSPESHPSFASTFYCQNAQASRRNRHGITVRKPAYSRTICNSAKPRQTGGFRLNFEPASKRVVARIFGEFLALCKPADTSMVKEWGWHHVRVGPCGERENWAVFHLCNLLCVNRVTFCSPAR